jgi:23S rRNA (cytosine1962-C5)-methyltransferase
VPGLPLPPRREFAAARFAESLDAAWQRRAPIFENGEVTAYRLLDGPGDGVPGIYLDRYGPAAVMNVYEDAHMSKTSVTAAAQLTLEMLAPAGLEAVYVKPFARDRSRLGGRLPDESLAATPCAGRIQPESLTVQEYESRFEVRLYEGHSTGLFLDHREHRRALSQRKPPRVLNLFAYTCAFAVPLAALGAHVTNVDVSARYLEWGRRNLALNGLEPSAARFFRMDAFKYLAYAARRQEERFDLVILDPPTFAAGDSRRGVKPWKALENYPALVQAALSVLAPGGLVFAASNTRELAGTGVLARVITKALGATPAWQPLPPWPVDVREPGRVAAVLFKP